MSLRLTRTTQRPRLMEFIGPNDLRTCGLCRHLLHAIVEENSPTHRLYRDPLHFLCRHRWVPIGIDVYDARRVPDFTPPAFGTNADSDAVHERLFSSEFASFVLSLYRHELLRLAGDRTRTAAQRGAALRALARLADAANDRRLRLLLLTLFGLALTALPGDEDEDERDRGRKREAGSH